jgi:NAD(P)-dependent dehydrogenase (short-subunit alcohol dehydrogenase family)
LLEGKTAVIYGAAGIIGRATAKAFAHEGAMVFLAGRTLETTQSLADEIKSSGGLAEASKVDALDPAAVEEHLKGIVAREGKLDVSYNLIATGVAMGSQLTQLSLEKFDRASFTRTKSCFITSTAAARIMQKQGHGVIMGITAGNGRLPVQETGGFSVGNAAIEALLKQLAMEAGPFGVRVVCLRTGATPENPALQEAYALLARARGTTKEQVERAEADHTALKRSPLIAEVANAAVIIASDYASAITATPVNASCGEMVD